MALDVAIETRRNLDQAWASAAELRDHLALGRAKPDDLGDPHLDKAREERCPLGADRSLTSKNSGGRDRV
jgi:hypothetical protein